MRTRFAFNPSKPMDILELRNLLFCYLIAKHDNGELIVSIEDSNQKEYSLENEENFYKLLDFFHIAYDEGPKKGVGADSYVQSERLDLYKTYAEKLIKRGAAYYCFCSKEELNRKRLEATEQGLSYQYDKTHRNFPKDEALRKIRLGEKYVIRQAMPESELPISFKDKVYSDVSVPSSALDDQILIKSDGTPTYHFASALDDALYNVDLVIRNNKFLANTPKTIKLYESLGFVIPEFLHLPDIVGLNKDGGTLNDLVKQGFLPEAILNYVVHLGWNSKTNKEIYSLEELVRIFDYKFIQKRPAHFDMAKLKWFNHQYIMKMEDEKYLNFVKPYLENFYNLEGCEKEDIDSLLLAYKNKISFASEIVLLTYPIFNETIFLSENMKEYLMGDESIPNTLLQFKETIKNCTNWTREDLKQIVEQLKIKCNVSDSLFYMPIRVCLTGMKNGLPFYDLLYFLGKEKILNRMEEIV